MELMLFVGCFTAAEDFGVANNLPAVAVEQGARTAIGFAGKITRELANDWVKDFFLKLAEGDTVTEAYNYLTYESDFSITTLSSCKMYGDGSLKLDTFNEL